MRRAKECKDCGAITGLVMCACGIHRCEDCFFNKQIK